MDSLEPLVKEVEAELARQSNLAPWEDPAALLLQFPGIGVPSAIQLLAAIGDINRFPTLLQLVGYAGLGAGVHSSGQEHDGGRITKQGWRDIRKTMVAVAWVAVANHFHWKTVFDRLADRIGRNKAIVAIARKLLVGVWDVLAERVADREAIPKRVAGKFLDWSWKVGRVNRCGLTTVAFIRRRLCRVQVGENLTTVSRGKKTLRLPPPEPVVHAVG